MQDFGEDAFGAEDCLLSLAPLYSSSQNHRLTVTTARAFDGAVRRQVCQKHSLVEHLPWAHSRQL